MFVVHIYRGAMDCLVYIGMYLYALEKILVKPVALHLHVQYLIGD